MGLVMGGGGALPLGPLFITLMNSANLLHSRDSTVQHFILYHTHKVMRALL